MTHSTGRQTAALIAATNYCSAADAPVRKRYSVICHPRTISGRMRCTERCI